MILEKEYIDSISISHRKRFAQFFTPESIAQIMSDWILGIKKFESLLEPAFGLGIFSRILLKSKKDIQITGFDVDSVIFERAKNNFENNKNLNLFLEDYLFNDWENKYDGIICNPPYFKFHDYENKHTLIEIKKRLKINLSGFTNIYTLFLLKSIYQLNDGGRIAYIVPSEFINSDYGKSIKQYLIDTKLLRHIFIFDFKENVFNDVLTTSAILLLSKDNNNNEVQFSTIKNINDLENIKRIIKYYPNKSGQYKVSFNSINPNVKWRKYYQQQASSEYNNLIPFSRVAKVVRGIATGANEYFTFNLKKAEQYRINKENLIPCIIHSKDVKKVFFTTKDFELLANNNNKIFLFDGTANLNEEADKYIKFGEKVGVNQKYLTSKRNPWYSLENRPSAPIWVGVFNRNGLKFIRNEAKIKNLTTFHCIYPNNEELFHNVNIDLLFAYLLTDVAQEFFNDNRREYGDGLKKFEPNDLNNAMMLDLSKLSNTLENKIIELLNKYRKSVIANIEDQKYIDEINKIFIKEYKDKI